MTPDAIISSEQLDEFNKVTKEARILMKEIADYSTIMMQLCNELSERIKPVIIEISNRYYSQIGATINRHVAFLSIHAKKARVKKKNKNRIMKQITRRYANGRKNPHRHRNGYSALTTYTDEALDIHGGHDDIPGKTCET